MFFSKLEFHLPSFELSCWNNVNNGRWLLLFGLSTMEATSFMTSCIVSETFRFLSEGFRKIMWLLISEKIVWWSKKKNSKTLCLGLIKMIKQTEYNYKMPRIDKIQIGARSRKRNWDLKYLYYFIILCKSEVIDFMFFLLCFIMV